MLKLLQSICHLLEEGEDLCLTTVIGHSGSTPRSVGTKMVVRRNGSIIGTIGGGLVEFHAQECAAAALGRDEGRDALARPRGWAEAQHGAGLLRVGADEVARDGGHLLASRGPLGLGQGAGDRWLGGHGSTVHLQVDLKSRGDQR